MNMETYWMLAFYVMSGACLLVNGYWSNKCLKLNEDWERHCVELIDSFYARSDIDGDSEEETE